MKKKMIIKLFVIVALMAMGCNRDDDNKGDQGCLKEENYFDLKMEEKTFEPYFLVAGGLSFYTLNVTRCSRSSNDWAISINTKENISVYIYIKDVSQPGNYPIFAGNNDHVPAICSEKMSLYIFDEISNAYTYISDGTGELTFTKTDRDIGLFVGTFQCEVTNVQYPNIRKTVSGNFSVNKSTLNNFERPCWL
ncbi:MAG: hypothetical protein WBA61_10710 [Aequorivita sp.]